MNVFIAHKELRDRIGYNGSGTANGMGFMFQKRVLAHASDVDHKMDENHWNYPAMENEGPRNRPSPNPKIEQRHHGYFPQNPWSFFPGRFGKSENRNGRDVYGKAEQQSTPRLVNIKLPYSVYFL